ncbi:hypothetical protein GCM10020254_28650 [Streptomyces goshikiensis]
MLAEGEPGGYGVGRLGADVGDAARSLGDADGQPVERDPVLGLGVMGAEVGVRGGELDGGLGEFASGQRQVAQPCGGGAARGSALAHPQGAPGGLGGLVPAAEVVEALRHVAADPGLGVQQPGPADEFDPPFGQFHRFPGPAHRFELRAEVDVYPSRDHREAEFGGPFQYRVQFGEARFRLPGVGEHAGDRDPGVELGLLGADHPGVRHGPFGGGEVVGAGVVEHAPARGPDEDVGVHLGRGQPLDEFLGPGQFLPAVAPAEAGDQPGALGPEPGLAQRVVTVLQHPQRRLGHLQGAFPLPAEPGGDGGLGDQVEPVERGGGGVTAAGRVHLGVVRRAQPAPDLLGGAVPQVQRPLQQAQLLGVGVPAAGGDGGGEHGGQRLGGVVGAVPVAGQPDGPFLGAEEGFVGLHGLGVTAVDAGALAGQQVVADGLADEGVAEAVAVTLGGGEEDVGADGGPQGLDELVLGESGDGAQQRVLDGGSAFGDDPHHALGGVREDLDADEQQIAQGFGESGAAVVLAAGDEFLDEEGVAVGAFEDGVDELLVGPGGEDPGELAADLGPVEAGQFDPYDGAEPVQFGEERAQGGWRRWTSSAR